MLDRRGHQAVIQAFLDRDRVGIIARESNANTITHYLACDATLVARFRARIEDAFPDATVRARRVAVVCALGSDLDVPGLLARCASALAAAGIPILALHQSIRAVDIQFVVRREDYEAAVVCLHTCALAIGRNVPRVA
jgi:aspartate kinase